jgi:sortase A
MLSAGIAILSYTGFQYGAMLFEQRRLEARWLQQQRIAPIGDQRTRAALHQIGLTRISIPSVNFGAVVVEGTDLYSMMIGPGHLIGTAEPGEPGNAVVIAHRDTFFRKLTNLNPGDQILIARDGQVFTYAVEGLKIVKANDRSVAAPTGDNRLTLITCDPAYYPGPAPQRLIVVSKLVAAPPSVAALKSLRPNIQSAAMRKARIGGPLR